MHILAGVRQMACMLLLPYVAVVPVQPRVYNHTTVLHLQSSLSDDRS